MKVGVITLGCPKNIVDSEILISFFLREGYEVIRELHELPYVDVIIINSCGFLKSAIEELLETAETVAELAPGKPVLVIGCAVSRLRDDLEGLERALKDIGVNLKGLISTGHIFQLPSILNRLLGESQIAKLSDKLQEDYSWVRRAVTSSPHWAYLKIAEGCSHKCSFCTIPNIRGKYTSRSLEDILDEARELADSGIKELILISQDSSFWGTDLYGRPMIHKLLEELEELPFKWIRVMYLYPTQVYEDLLGIMLNSDKVLPYFDLPIQHIDPKVLKLMARNPNPEVYHKLVEKIRENPKSVIRATFIVGHPGEDDEAFKRLIEFLRWGKFERIGLFKYSPEPETPSASLPQVPEEVKEERMIEALNTAEELLSTWMNRRLNETHQAIIEDYTYGGGGIKFTGRVWFDAPDVDGQVVISAKVPISKVLGKILDVKLVKAIPEEATFEAELEL